VTRISCCLATALLAYASHAVAQEFPTRFVTIVAPFQAGGPSDTVARLIAAPMSKALGQQVVVENVTGAGGTIGSGRVAKAAPDGYTLGISGSGTHAAVEQLYANPPYRALDFESVGLVNTTPVVIVGKRDLPPNTLQELVAYLRAHEKTVTEADAGVGSVSHLACSVFHSLIGIKPTVVSYRGTPQATQDILAGNVDFLCNQIVNIVEHAKAGSLKAYAVTGERRSAMLPDVPTTTEAVCRTSSSRSGTASPRPKARRRRSWRNSTRRWRPRWTTRLSSNGLPISDTRSRRRNSARRPPSTSSCARRSISGPGCSAR
jgi:tripartite-type tricarboxylate transporter receptor subunit TctC